MDEEPTGSGPRTDWEQRRRSAASRSQTGAYASVGVSLALAGAVLGLVRVGQGARHAPVLDGLLWIVLFLVLGILVLIACRLLDAVLLRD